jgi:amidophosphoribosyltransferase
MIDDSIVRGTTSSKLVEMVRSCGAKEVHLLISSPPVCYSCYYGIDTAEREKLVANKMSIEEIRKFVGADTLYYLSEEGLRRALGGNSFCSGVFNGVLSDHGITEVFKLRSGMLKGPSWPLGGI